jgi:2-keto-4-pentenoate hydratase/2-oxohepta-3-ene-1,7-dioic acid hydratase in catechol pathway
MRLVSFQIGKRNSYGVVAGQGIVDAGTKLAKRFPTLQSVLAAGALGELKKLAGSAKPDFGLGEVTLLPPIPAPGKIIAVGLNYHEHRKETGREPAAYPTLFTRFADTLVGHGQPLVRPRASKSFDYEGELAVVIGKPTRAATARSAMQAVAGYACFNDATVRDYQRHASQFTPGKNFPGSAGFGPWLVTADEVKRPQALNLTTRLNGRVMQAANTREMIFSIAQIICYVSIWTQLRPGDVIATGTPAGVGFVRDPPVFLKPKDVVEVEISGPGADLGCLRNPVAAERAR